jgi:carbamoyltransferase
MVWDGGEPTLGRVWSDRWTERFGPARAPGDPIESRHRNLAASLQACVEEVLFRLLRRLHDRTGVDRLCMAGGVAFNSVANGKILDETPFREVFLQPAAGDAGTALGAAFHVWHETLGNPRAFRMHHAYWGPEFDDSAMAAALESRRGALAKAGVRTVQGSDGDAVIALAARALAEGKVLGWFQGRMEWGPRALGNRSILADPRRAAMKERLNEIVKKREAFRPFCPSVMAEHSGEWFARGDPEPFMIRVFPVRPEKRAEIPAVTHVDGSGRLQTVSERDNPRYWRLLRAFRDLTGVPILLNTSFNENEPIVCRPEEALDCFLRTRMDVLVLGDTLLERPGGGAEGKAP